MRADMRKRVVLAIVAVVALVLSASIAFVIGRSTTGTRAPAPQAQAPVSTRHEPAAPPPTAGQDCRTQWTAVPGAEAVPESSCYGPKQKANGLATQFSKDTLGAVYAGMNITSRIASAAGPAIYQPTLERQTLGDHRTALSLTQQETSTTPSWQTVPQEWWWKPVGGSAESGLITISLAARTPQAEQMGGYAGLTVTMQWSDGDWKLRLPKPSPELISSVAGYESLGKPRA